MRHITRDDLRTVLRAWQSGEIGAAEVHDWAESLYAVPAPEAADEIVNKVLAHLDILDISLTTVRRHPVYLKMLELTLDRGAEAIDLLRAHGDSLDMAARMKRY